MSQSHRRGVSGTSEAALLCVAEFSFLTRDRSIDHVIDQMIIYPDLLLQRGREELPLPRLTPDLFC